MTACTPVPVDGRDGGDALNPDDAGTRIDAGDLPDAGDVQPGETFAFPPLQTDVPHYFLTIEPAVLSAILGDLYSNDERPAKLTIGSQTWDVGVRLRGSSSRRFDKKSWRIEFPEGTKVDGRRKHNLLSEFQDVTLMTEKLGYDLMRGMGAPAPVAKYVRLTINGQYQGVLLDLQRVDKDFLDWHLFADRDANIYRCGGKDCEMKLWRTSYQKQWTKKTNETQPDDDIHALMRVINRTPEPQLVKALERHLELDDYLKSMTMEALISNHIVTDSGSYMIHDAHTDRWTYVPWDINNASSTFWKDYPAHQEPFPKHPIPIYSLLDGWIENLYLKRLGDAPDYLPAFSNLNTRIAFHPELRERFCDLLEQALDEIFDPAVVLPRIDAMYELIVDHMRDDPFVDPVKFAEGPRFLKAYAERREAFLREELERLREWNVGLVLETVDGREGWIELRNHGSREASLAGLVVTANLRKALTPNLPARVLQPNETVRFTEAQLGIDLQEEGEVGLFTGKSVAGAIDVLIYGKTPAGTRYRRSGAQPLVWEVR